MNIMFREIENNKFYPFQDGYWCSYNERFQSTIYVLDREYVFQSPDQYILSLIQNLLCEWYDAFGWNADQLGNSPASHRDILNVYYARIPYGGPEKQKQK